MNICILTSVHPVYDSRIYFKQALSLLKAGHNVSIIARGDKGDNEDGISIIALPTVKNRFVRILRTPELLFRAWKQKADVYHFHDPELIPLGLVLKITQKGKIIYDVHEDYPEAILSKKWIPCIFRKVIAGAFNKVEKWSARHFHHVITATDGISARFTNIGHLTSIKNYPIIAKFNNQTTHVSSSIFNLIYTGVLTAERGVNKMVEALTYIEASKDIILRLYGKFESPAYQDTVLKMKGAERVKYMGWINPDELWPIMTRADCGVICLHPLERYKISLPIKLFEYMAAGLPVIASNFKLWNEIIQKHNCGIVVDPLDVHAIAKAIKSLMENKEQAKIMGENGRNAVIAKYNWETESKKLIFLYNSLTNKN
jgi:glycosyltransferase involved in cell wall biosynthesis